MKLKNSDHRGNPLYIFQIFSRVSKLNFFPLYKNKYNQCPFSKFLYLFITKLASIFQKNQSFMIKNLDHINQLHSLNRKKVRIFFSSKNGRRLISAPYLVIPRSRQKINPLISSIMKIYLQSKLNMTVLTGR